MYRLAVMFTSFILVAAWSAPIDAAGEQRRARRRDPGTTQTQPAPQRSAPPRASAPQRSAPARRAPAPRQRSGDQNDGAAGRTGDTRARQVAPPASPRGRRATTPQQDQPGAGRAVRRVGRRGRTEVSQAGRANGRITRTRRTGNTRPTPQANRRPTREQVVGTAVPRPPLSSRPITINTRGGRGRGVLPGYTPYRGRYRYGVPRIYGTHFYFPGYTAFNAGFGMGYGSSYGYNPYGYGLYGHGYGYNPYTYDGYGRDYYTGSLRLRVRPRFGEVFVDGYYVGLVNDYDGVFQRLRLDDGPHRIEITEPGFETLAFDVLILPGETITYEGDLAPLP